MSPQRETKPQFEGLFHAAKYHPMGQRGMPTRNTHTKHPHLVEQVQGARADPRLNIASANAVENLDQQMAAGIRQVAANRKQQRGRRALQSPR